MTLIGMTNGREEGGRKGIVCAECRTTLSSSSAVAFGALSCSPATFSAVRGVPFLGEMRVLHSFIKAC